MSNQIDIGDAIYGSTAAATGGAVVKLGGKVYLPSVGGGTAYAAVCITSAGLLIIDTGANCFGSQRKLKENFADVSGATAMSDLLALKPTQFNFKATTSPNRDPNATATQYGFIAEDVAAVDPKLAVYTDDMKTPKSWRVQSVLALLVKATQDQQKTVQEQQKEIDELKAELKTLQEQQVK